MEMFFGMEINLFILYMLKRKYFDLANLLRLIDEKNHHYLYFRDFNRLLRNTVKHELQLKKMKKIIRMQNVFLIVIKNMKMMAILSYKKSLS